VDRRLLAGGVAIVAVLATSLGTAGSAAGATGSGSGSAATAAAGAAAAGKGITGKTRALGAKGTTKFVPGKQGSVKGVQKNEVAREPREEGGGEDSAARVAGKSASVPLHDRSLTRRPSAAQSARVASAAKSVALPKAITPTGARLIRSFEGLTQREQRLADNANQFTVEPPDQALCVGKGYVVEGVNDAVRVNSTSGRKGGVMSLNKFFGLPSAIDRTKGVFGPFTTDPTCVYDSSTGTFYFVMLEIAVNPTTGAFTGANYLDIAVTQKPTGSWRIYRLPVQDDGSEGTPVHPNCPCIGDYPHIGFDGYGFYITTNEYSFFGPEYNSAQVYAFDKKALATGAKTIYVTQFDTTGVEKGRNGFTIWPAHSPSARDFDRRRAGTAYFLSSNAAEEATGTDAYTSNSIVFWAMTGTSTLNRAHPSARLRLDTLPVARYSLPPLAPQKNGLAPLRDCLNDATCVKTILDDPKATPTGEVLSPLDANDTRMQQVMFVRGRLYGALDTAVKLPSGVQAGIAWYVVDVVGRTSVHGRVSAQGQFGVDKHALIYPSIGMTDSGRGVIGFTLTGKNFYPTAAFAGFTRRGPEAIRVASLGKAPQDGFSGYKAFADEGANPRPRWGDYSAASVVGGDVWIANEYIGAPGCTLAQYQATAFSCGGTRTALANWTTRISLVRP
jgi:hypothetical protein